ncbi:MAG: FHA domain-containing protein [Bdellovibrionaceae bacterium]|nr:FHA domain-containing protein [Pseudobdellovibrionaceae bacterium]
MSNLAPQNQVEYTVTIISGPDKGETFKLMSILISIGRASTNDIVLAKDVKCSRQHAEIHISSSGIIIKSLNKDNLVEVDGQQGEALMVNHNSKIRVGSTKLLFQISMLIKEETQNISTLQMVPNDTHTERGIGPSHPQQVPQAPALPLKLKKANNFRMFLIAVIVLLALVALNEKKDSLSKSTGIRTDEDIENEIETRNKILEAERKLKQKKGLNSPQFNEAQTHYIKGFRDYKRGKYERALYSFQACISIFPEHELCETYKKLSTKKFQELIQYHLVTGLKFLDKGQYSACKSSFKNVMFMVRDNSNKTYQEAEANYRLCESRLEGRF